MESILKVKDLCKTYIVNKRQNNVLRNVSFEVGKGEMVAVMGPSGSGKSTLLYTVSGMDTPTSGEVDFCGSDIAKMNAGELSKLRLDRMGFIFQQMHLVSNLSLFENIAVPGYLNKRKTASRVRERAEELLEQMGIAHLKSHLPSQVSGGEQQRCAIARAVIHNPRLLFADEPTGALNKKSTTEVLDLLTSLNRSGQSILMVTHDIRAALRATRLLYLEDGKVVGELPLPDYSPEEEKSREAQVNAWLSAMEW